MTKEFKKAMNDAKHQVNNHNNFLAGAEWAYEYLFEELQDRMEQGIRYMRKIEDLEQKLALAIEALEFYAVIDANIPSAALAVDKFDKARQALAKIKGED